MSAKSVVAIVDSVGRRAGMDYYDLALLNALSARGVRTLLFSNFVNGGRGVTFVPSFDAEASSFFPKILDYFGGYLRSYLGCKKEKVDAVILHLFSTSWDHLFKVAAARLFRLRVVVIAHDISSFGRRDSRLGRWLIFNHLCQTIVVHNRFSYDKLIEGISDKRKNLVRVIKHGNYLPFISDPLSKKEAAARLHLDPAFFNILFFGQIKKVKGLDTLLRALRHMDARVRLVIAGRPWKDDFSKYQNMILELGLQDRVVLYVRHVPDDERELLFGFCDAAVVPYRIIYQSGVLLMAMSHGLPVVASDLTAIREVIDDGKNGLLFDCGDETALARQVNRLSRDPALCEEIGAAALATMKVEYAWEAIAGSYMEVLQL